MTPILIPLIISIIFWIWIIRKYDKFEREPLRSIIYVLIVGGLVSVIPAGLFNLLFASIFDYSVDAASGVNLSAESTWLFFGFAGFNEEVWKASATVLLIRRMKQFNEPADALVYSMTVALGFAAFENIEYAINYGTATVYFRQFNAVPLHLGLAAIWGIGIAKARFDQGGQYTKTLIPYLFLAGIIHFAYNIAVFLFADPLLQVLVPSFIAIYLIRRAVKRIKRYAEEGPFSKVIICQNCKTPNQLDDTI